MNTYKLLCQLLQLIDRLAFLFYTQDDYNGIAIHRRIVSLIPGLLQNQGDSGSFCNALNRTVTKIPAYQEAGDYIGMADVYSGQLKKLCEAELEQMRSDGIWQEICDVYEKNYLSSSPLIKQMLDNIHAEIEDIPAGYELIETTVGSFTLQTCTQDATHKILLSSMNNPYDEADRMVDAYCRLETAQYDVLGLGMGYLARAMSEREDILKIHIFEHDVYVIKAAFHYMDLSDILSMGKLEIVYDPSLAAFAQALKKSNDNTTDSGFRNHSGMLGSYGIVIHRPSMRNIQNPELRNKVENFFLHDSSVRSQGRKLNGNFYMNTETSAIQEVQALDELRTVFSGKNMLLIAGGPSLEEALPVLEQNSEDFIVSTYSDKGVEVKHLSDFYSDEDCEEYIVVAVGTVLGRLLASGIKPDYVVMTDAQKNMTNQIMGIDTFKLALIYLPTLYYEVPRQWKGKKYMGLQRGFAPSERLAKELGRALYETGGSVATLAFDIGLRFGCNKVVCLGLDLAFVDDKRHAGDFLKISGSTEEYRQVLSVSGKMVYTSRNLDNYRIWFERRIASRTEEEKKVELINCSRGAMIKGMKCEGIGQFFHSAQCLTKRDEKQRRNEEKFENTIFI